MNATSKSEAASLYILRFDELRAEWKLIMFQSPEAQVEFRPTHGVRHTTVRLTGAVRSREARDAAEWDAWYVFGIDDVINELEVVP